MNKPADRNRNAQRLLRITEAMGSDYNAKVWILKCGACGSIYGCNSTDAFQRKCPVGQGGKRGLAIPSEWEGAKWSREEHVIAFHLYSQIPFGSIPMNNPKVIELAALLGRSVGSMSFKLSNFARLDPTLQARGIRGLQHGAKGEEAVWDDRGVMDVDEGLRVRFSPRLRDEAAGAGDSADWPLAFDGRELILPPKFSRDLTLLARHRERWRAAA